MMLIRMVVAEDKLQRQASCESLAAMSHLYVFVHAGSACHLHKL